MRPLRAAFPAEPFRILLLSAPHAAIGTAAQPPARSASLQSPASQKTQLRRRVRLRPSPTSGSYSGHPQRTRSTVPMTRRFRHSSPRLSSVSRCLGPTQVVTPFHHLSGDSHHHAPLLGVGPITASSHRSIIFRHSLTSNDRLTNGHVQPFSVLHPTKAIKVPSIPDWRHEMKFDGYRLRLKRDGDRRTMQELPTVASGVRGYNLLFIGESVTRGLKSDDSRLHL